MITDAMAAMGNISPDMHAAAETHQPAEAPGNLEAMFMNLLNDNSDKIYPEQLLAAGFQKAESMSNNRSKDAVDSLDPKNPESVYAVQDSTNVSSLNNTIFSKLAGSAVKCITQLDTMS